jgi:hypothetical protein
MCEVGTNLLGSLIGLAILTTLGLLIAEFRGWTPPWVKPHHLNDGNGSLMGGSLVVIFLFFVGAPIVSGLCG